jgi:cytochrome c551/c552
MAALTVVEQNGAYLQYAARHIRDDKEVVMAAVENWGPAIMYATPKMKNNPEVGLEAVRRNGKMLAYLSDNLRNSPRIVKAALKQTPSAEKYIGPKLQDRMQGIEGDLTPLQKLPKSAKKTGANTKNSYDWKNSVRLNRNATGEPSRFRFFATRR